MQRRWKINYTLGENFCKPHIQQTSSRSHNELPKLNGKKMIQLENDQKTQKHFNEDTQIANKPWKEDPLPSHQENENENHNEIAVHTY